MSDKMTFGDVRDDLSRDHMELLEKTMNRCNPKHDKPYFILMVPSWNEDQTILKTSAIVTPYQWPIQLIGTISYKVDPKSGAYNMEYCKPRDIPTSPIITDFKRSDRLDQIANYNMNSYTPIIHN